MQTRQYSPFKTQLGFTILEVMVALLVFSVGLLGMAGMQMASMQNNHSGMLRTIAVQQAYQMADRVRSNRAGFNNNLYDNVVTCTQPCASIEQMDFTDWQTANNALLPGGTGTVQRNGTSLNINVHWDEDRSGAAGTNCPPRNSNDLRCYTLTVVP